LETEGLIVKKRVPLEKPPNGKMYRGAQQREDVGLAYRALMPAIQERKAEYLAIAQKGYPGALLKPGEVDGLFSVGNMATHDKRPLNMGSFCLQGVMFVLNFQGVLAVKVNHKKYLVYPRELLIMHPGTHFAIGDPVMSCVRLGWLILDVNASDVQSSWSWPDWLMLEEGEKEELTHELIKQGVSVQKVSDDFIQAFKRLAMLSSNEEIPHRGSRLKQLLSFTMLELLECFQSHGDRGMRESPRSLHSAQEFLAHLPDHLAEPWTIQTMAEACGLGVSKFSEQVNILTAESPAKHLAGLRLERACVLLRDKSVPLEVIAKQTGYSCASYFTRAFVRRYHKYPTQFRNET
jgi:AraC family L-rhamnose operon regulatory protein RhaS